jgi:hypothetical membrane protein
MLNRSFSCKLEVRVVIWASYMAYSSFTRWYNVISDIEYLGDSKPVLLNCFMLIFGVRMFRFYD